MLFRTYIYIPLIFSDRQWDNLVDEFIKHSITDLWSYKSDSDKIGSLVELFP